MTILTDEIVEKAARAVYEARHSNAPEVIYGPGPPGPLNPGAPNNDWINYIGHARAALTAVLPDVIERCAQTGRDFIEYVYGDNHKIQANDLYESIRSLNSKGE